MGLHGALGDVQAGGDLGVGEVLAEKSQHLRLARRHRLFDHARRQISRRSLAHAVSWWRLESCSLRSTAETWDSIVFTDRCSRLATSL